MEAKDFIEYVENGVYTPNGKKRPLDILDYYILSNGVPSEDFINANKNSVYYKKIVAFFNRNRLGDPLRDYEIGQIMVTKDEVNLKRDKNGMPIPGTGRVITNEEKQGIINFLLSNNVPLTKKIYLLAFRRYVDGEMDIMITPNKSL